jgi:CheY-like chemotaxis protein
MATYRIYLTDDDRFLLDMYAVKFKAAGHEVTAFQSGRAVLEELRAKPAPDALLLDVVMPEIDGFQVLDTIRNQGQETDIEKAKALGAAGYIIKASAIPSEVYAETIAIIEKKV